MERQAVAANFDYVFLVMSMNHDFNQNRLDRYLTAAWGEQGDAGCHTDEKKISARNRNIM